MQADARRLTGELLGTALLLYVIVGSGIAVERLSTDGAIQLAVHGIAVGAGLGALIAFLGPVSGAHFNPSVSIGLAITRDFSRGAVTPYILAQLLGAATGVILANLSFSEPGAEMSTTVRAGSGLLLAEFVATFVLVLLIVGLVRSGRPTMIPAAGGAGVATIIIATASTGFANPAVTVARMLTDTFTGIDPASVAGFLSAQLVAALAAGVGALWLFPSSSEPATSPVAGAHDRRDSRDP